MASSDKSKNPQKRRRSEQNGDTADWAAADAELLRRVIETIAVDGGAIRFGYSRDGGAYSIGIYGDGDPFTEYLPCTGDVNFWLEGIKLDYE